MLRLFLCLVLALAATGCDSSGDGGAPEPVFADLVVAMTSPTTISLATADAYSVPYQLVVDRQRTEAGLRLNVRGARPPGGPVLSVEAPATAIVPIGLAEGTYSVLVEHLGQTDAYRLTLTSRGYSLAAVRTSTTRLAEAP